MSTDLSPFEAKVDAFTHAIFWNLDEKIVRSKYRTFHKNNPFLFAIDCLEYMWETVTIRLSLAFIAPYILRHFEVVEDPSGLAKKLLIFGIVWPWIYRSFIYNVFLDPLRHLPGPKVVHHHP